MFSYIFLLVYYVSSMPSCNDAWVLPLVIGAGAALGVTQAVNSSRNRQAIIDNTNATNQANLQIARETNAANADLYSRQFADAMYAWDVQNKYNTPAAEVERLRAAGINPALAFGQGSSAGSVSLPSAAPAVGAEMQQTPYQAYTDTALTRIEDLLPAISQSLSQFEDFQSRNIDNQTRAEINRKQLDTAEANYQAILTRKDLDKKQIEDYEEKISMLRLMRRLNESKFDDMVEYQNLMNKFLQTQERVLNEQNTRDAARLAIEDLNARSQRALNAEQALSVRTMANIALNVDWRDSQKHVVDMHLKNLDEHIKQSQLNKSQVEEVFQSFMTQSEMMHTDLKDASLVNKLMERAFGLGFRDVGNALRSLLFK